MNNVVREYLIKIARTKDDFVSYSQLVKDCKLNYNLGTQEGKKQLSHMLGVVSTFEYESKRPLLTSLVIYKDPNKNDQGPGFYKLAQHLGIGNAKKLQDALYGFEEAKQCRKYWQNDVNYQKESLSSSLINLYNDLIAKHNWIFSWKKEYLEFLSEIEIIRTNIDSFPSLKIDDSKLYNGVSKRISNYEDFMNKLLKEKVNGISSRGQSVLSGKNFRTIIEDDNFKIIITKCISNPSLSSYNLLKKWWINNEEISNRPLLINRILAALNYKDLSSTVHDSKFWSVINVLKESYQFEFKEEPQGNWYIANKDLSEWLDEKLSTTFEDNIQGNVEYYVLRNIFVWLIFEEYGSKSKLYPNQLLKKELGNEGYDSVPNQKRNFNEVDIDYVGKNKRAKDLGDAGEDLVKQYEKAFLKINKLDELSDKVKIVKDGKGYDVYSFDINGNPKFIEVKTTQGNALTPFYLSENEVEFMRINVGNYFIYRVYNYDEENNSGEFFEINEDVEAKVLMKPISYKVYKKKP
ncbi:uncharacterized protein DUF3883 [Arenibacter algicola]|uniref:Uncharacterized protein DUF3883 n=1 Tax=Arenibacter algicola TaxID=616991 RepID=A0ABY3A8A4_9FLAO